jgi:hypothetical protein
VFLDYDGVLTPIVNRPKDGVICDSMRDTVQALAQRCTVCVVSGRDRAVVEELVGVNDLVVAGGTVATSGARTGARSSTTLRVGSPTSSRPRTGCAPGLAGSRVWWSSRRGPRSRCTTSWSTRTSVTDLPRRRAPCSPSPTGGRSCPARWSISSTRRSTGATPTTSRSPTGLRRRLRPLLPPEVE